MAQILTDTLRTWKATPFEWGRADCLVSVLEYAERLTGRRLRDRPSHTCPQSALAWAQARGGFVQCFDIIANDLGLVRRETPLAGDVGLIDLHRLGYVGALRTPHFWAARIDRGVIRFRVPPARVASCWGLRNA